MKPFATLALLVSTAAAPLLADGIVSPWSRVKQRPDASQGALVAQTVGVDDWVQIAYHRPGAKGRDVWTESNARGQKLVPRDGDPGPWRAGANEATTIEFTSDVMVQGSALAAGRYALFMIPGDEHWTLIFQDDEEQWGSGEYDAAADTLRVQTTAVEAPHAEWLTYGFDAPDAWSTVAWLHWGNVKVPFTIAVDEVR